MTVAAPRSPTIDEFSAYVEALPRQLQAWSPGYLGLYPALGWLNTQPVMEERAMIASGAEVEALRTVRMRHNQVGIAVAWAAYHHRLQEATAAA